MKTPPPPTQKKNFPILFNTLSTALQNKSSTMNQPSKEGSKKFSRVLSYHWNFLGNYTDEISILIL